MNLRNLYAGCIICSLTAVSVSAQETDTAVSVQRRLYEHESMIHQFVQAPYQNPAFCYYRYRAPLSMIALSGENKDESIPLVAEEGDGRKGFGVHASSYTLLSRTSRLWGEASYRNGTRKHVLWNENSDFDILYPYVAADSVGGDMKNETYFFDGGYAWRDGRWTFGGELSYRAVLEYRDIDPRPRNLSARITGKMGATYRVLPQYAVGISAEAHKYRQEGSIQFYNELGGNKTYHLSGLGMSYTRFNGSRTNTDYQGREFGTSLSFLPVSEQGGWHGTLSYRHFSLDKTLPEVNDIELNNLSENTFGIDAGWLSASNARHCWGVKVSASQATRNGTENLFGDPSGNQYPWISSAEQFKRDITQAALAGFYEHRVTDTWRWSASPTIAYLSRTETYNTPHKKMDYQLLDAHLTLKADYLQKNNSWRVSLQGGHTASLGNERQTGTATTPFAEQILAQDFLMQGNSRTSYAVAVRWSRQMFRRMAVYVEASWHQTFYTDLDEHARQTLCTIGVTL